MLSLHISLCLCFSSGQINLLDLLLLLLLLLRLLRFQRFAGDDVNPRHNPLITRISFSRSHAPSRCVPVPVLCCAHIREMSRISHISIPINVTHQILRRCYFGLIASVRSKKILILLLCTIAVEYNNRTRQQGTRGAVAAAAGDVVPIRYCQSSGFTWFGGR